MEGSTAQLLTAVIDRSSGEQRLALSSEILNGNVFAPGATSIDGRVNSRNVFAARKETIYSACSVLEQGNRMKHCLVVTVGLCLAPSALAASAPPTTVMMGTVATANIAGTNGYHCSANAGQASFQRGATSAGIANPSAILSLPGVAVGTQFSGPSYIGVLALKFANARGGTASFDYDQSTINSNLPSSGTAPFGNYSQVWSPRAGTLKVSFNILFKNCTLPVIALFRTAS